MVGWSKWSSSHFNNSYRSLEIIGTVSGTSTNITSLSSATTLSEPSFLTASGVDYNVTIRLRGGTPPGNGGQGSYVQGTFTAKAGKSYRLHYDTRYSAVFYGTSAVGNNCIMLAAEGGYEGYPSRRHMLHHIHHHHHQNLMVVMLDILLETTVQI